MENIKLQCRFLLQIVAEAFCQIIDYVIIGAQFMWTAFVQNIGSFYYMKKRYLMF